MKSSFEQSAEALVRVLEAVPDFLLVLDPDGTLLYINHVEEWFDRDELIGKQAVDIVSAGSRAMHLAALGSLLETGDEQRYDVVIETPDGTPQWYRSRMLPIRQDGRIDAVLLVATNVTELKTAQQAAQQFRSLLPICSWCDRIRNADGAWEGVESYLEREANIGVSHGLCPDCDARQTKELEVREG